MLGGFVSHCVAQLNLFNEDAPRANGEVLMSLMNEINQQDRGMIYFAGQSIQ